MKKTVGTRRTKASSSKRKENKKTNVGQTVRIPHDSVNEMVVIAAVITSESARKAYLSTIPSDIMFGTGHALIWTTLQELYRKGLEYDSATMKQLGGSEVDTKYLDGLVSQRPVVPKNLAHHVAMLKWDAARISTAQGPVTSFLELLKDPRTDPSLLRSAADRIGVGLSSGANSSLRNSEQLIAEQMKVIRERRKGIATYGFGIPGLDCFEDGYSETNKEGRTITFSGQPRLIPGTAPEKVTLVTGVSGSGKTTAMTRGALGMYEDGRRIAYGAYEQGSGMTLELMAGMSLGMSRTDLMTGHFDDDDERELFEEMSRISESVLFDEIPFVHFESRRERFLNQRAMDRIAQTIVDSRCDVYVADLFRRTMGETDPSDEERALYRMQEMAKALKVHIVLVHQQNLKDVEATKAKIPRRDTIKGSGAYVEVPDTIVGFHRPALWKNIPDDVIYSLVLKQRFGRWPMMVAHDWDPVFGSIEGGKTVEMQFGNDDEACDSDPFFDIVTTK